MEAQVHTPACSTSDDSAIDSNKKQMNEYNATKYHKE